MRYGQTDNQRKNVDFLKGIQQKKSKVEKIYNIEPFNSRIQEKNKIVHKKELRNLKAELY